MKRRLIADLMLVLGLSTAIGGMVLVGVGASETSDAIQEANACYRTVEKDEGFKTTKQADINYTIEQYRGGKMTYENFEEKMRGYDYIPYIKKYVQTHDVLDAKAKSTIAEMEVKEDDGRLIQAVGNVVVVSSAGFIGAYAYLKEDKKKQEMEIKHE